MKVTSKIIGETNGKDEMTWPLPKQKLEMSWRVKRGRIDFLRDLMDDV